ncbi:DUF4347 domain-containing protein [Azospirillum halopraeferens]|uniref:DUF4347 domain-containing protein n=1 Tax=Azospirillum halopraeferens TaxID=34010 RepID=UPI00146F98F1|nr:DUF4347 domain-containing protein [Azospirillum halopraeferens]
MREILIADAALEDLAYLLERQRDGIRTVLVPRDGDAFAALSGALAARPGAIHLLGHGAPGAVRIGAAAIDSASILDRHWPLAPGTELLIHACRTGDGAAGRLFLDRLAAATGATVAASSGPVGDAAQGGSWTLDRATGPVATAAPFTGHEGWPHLLAISGTPSNGDDTLIGDDGDNVLYGLLGADYLYGGAGNDTLYGGEGSDTLDGGPGADYMDGGFDNAFDRVTYASAGLEGIVLDLENPANSRGHAAGDVIVRVDLIEGSEGNDLFIGKTTLAEGETGNDFFWGHGGDDTLYGGPGADTLEGGEGADWIDGGSEDDHLYGHWGNDTLLGNHGDDKLFGGSGDDLLIGHQGNDTIVGGLGNDTVYAGSEHDQVFGNRGADLLYGNQGNDTLFGGQDDDTLFGGQDRDLLYGQIGNDLVYGQLGDDTLFGGQGDDTMFGGQGDDVLYGNIGNDVLAGNRGNDTLFGGEGADTFVFGIGGGHDVIGDFSAAEGDRMRVVDGLTWTVADGGAGAVVTFSSGDTVTLTGIAARDVADTWFLTG